MIDRVLADLVVVLHLAFIVFVVFGGLLTLRWQRIPWIHLPAFAWAAALEFFGWICPLTPLENSLRRASGQAGYADGFIEHYFIPILYPADFNRELQLILGCLLVSLNLAVYWVVWRRTRRRQARR